MEISVNLELRHLAGSNGSNKMGVEETKTREFKRHSSKHEGLAPRLQDESKTNKSNQKYIQKLDHQVRP